MQVRKFLLFPLFYRLCLDIRAAATQVAGYTKHGVGLACVNGDLKHLLVAVGSLHKDLRNTLLRSPFQPFEFLSEFPFLGDK